MGEVGGSEEEMKAKEISIVASRMYPGFRFSPTDEELILYYLKNKIDGLDNSVRLIPLLDICKFEPWDLPAKATLQSEQEWFFFSPRGKKYPNGSQSKRATEIGYWKATGKEHFVKSGSNVIGTKRTLVFHIGRAPKGERTEWMMHEYCMLESAQDALVVCRLRRKSDYQGISSTMSGSETNSGSRPEPVGTSKGKNIAVSSLKKSSSSYDSYSVELKHEDEILPPESSSHAKRVNNEDDLFADILNDNIVELDECPTTSTTAGTANKRLRLRKQKHKNDLEEQTDENVVVNRPKPKRFLRPTILTDPMRLRVVGNRLYVVMVMTGWLLLLVSYAANPYTKTHYRVIWSVSQTILNFSTKQIHPLLGTNPKV